MFLNVTEISIFSFPMMCTHDGWKEGGRKKEKRKTEDRTGTKTWWELVRESFSAKTRTRKTPALMEFFSDPVCC